MKQVGNDCNFNLFIKLAEKSFCGYIYYTSNTSFVSTSSHTSLSISNCEFPESKWRINFHNI